MPIEVQKVQPRGSFVSNIMGIFNTAKGTYNAMKGGSGGAEKQAPEFTTGSDPTKPIGQNSLGGQDKASQLGGQASDFQGSMDAITRRAYSLESGAKAPLMDGEASAYGANGAAEAAGAYGAAGAAAGGYGATSAGAAAGGYAGADAASSSIMGLA